MPDAIRVLSGDCTVVYDAEADRRERRGRVVTTVKPDNTVLVHDEGGYQPVAWLTRADAVSWGRDPAGSEGDFAITARKGEECLRVAAHDEEGFARYPVSAAGIAVGDCPACDERLVRDDGEVTCLGCGDAYRLPAGAAVRGGPCECGLPRIRVERGTAFDLCLDRDCDHTDTLDEAVRGAFDRAFDCPDCDGDLRVVRQRGLTLRCDAPDCRTTFAIPRGTVEGECACGLPAFETGAGRECLDANCDRATVADPAVE